MPLESRRCASQGESAPSMRHINCREVATATAEVLSAISVASAYAAGSNSSAGYVRATRPPRRASSASKTRPVATHSRAWLMPTTRGRNQLEAASMTTPRRENTKPNFAVSAASLMSIGSVIVIPTPTAGPLMAAITGFKQAATRRLTLPPPSRGTPSMVSAAAPDGWRRSALNVSPPPERSAPAQNALPRPVTTTARTSSSESARSKASISSSRITRVNALSRSGRLRMIVATRSATRYSISEYGRVVSATGWPPTVVRRVGLGVSSRPASGRRGHAPGGDGGGEGLVVTVVLVGVGGGELGDGLVEDRGLAEVGGDRDPVTGPGVRPGQRPPAQLAVGAHSCRGHRFDVGGDLPVP